MISTLLIAAITLWAIWIRGWAGLVAVTVFTILVSVVFLLLGS